MAVSAEGCGQVVVGAGLRRELVPSRLLFASSAATCSSRASASRRVPCGRRAPSAPARPPSQLPRATSRPCSSEGSCRSSAFSSSIRFSISAVSASLRERRSRTGLQSGSFVGETVLGLLQAVLQAVVRSSTLDRDLASWWRLSSYRSREVSSATSARRRRWLVREVLFFYPGLGAEQLGGEGVYLFGGLPRVGEVSFEAGPVVFQLSCCGAEIGVPPRHL